MAILDNYLIDWDIGVNNAPSDSDNIGTDLGAQIRNIKSVYRVLSFNKMYEDFDLNVISTLDAQALPGFRSSVIIVVANDVTTAFQPGRKILAKAPSSNNLLGGVITSTTYTVASNQTILFANFWGKSWSKNESIFYAGTDNITPQSFPITCIGGNVGIKGSDTNATVTFQTKQDTQTSVTSSGTYTNETKVFMPTKDYRVHLSPSYKDGNAVEDCSVIKKVQKNFDSFVIDLHTAPGVVGGEDQKIIFDWTITMPRYYS